MDENLILRSFNTKIKSKDKKKLSNYLGKINNLGWPKFIQSYKKNYSYSFSKNLIKNYKNIKNINIIGMGGSSLGVKAIYNFLINKINKKNYFL